MILVIGNRAINLCFPWIIAVHFVFSGGVIIFFERIEVVNKLMAWAG